jgi:general secretion pathway protein B
MSFILDALKKSESDRQRQGGPGLYEVKVAAPRSPLPHWAVGLLVLLGINLIVVAWALLKRPAHPPDTQATAAALAPTPPNPAYPAVVATTAPSPTAPLGQPPVAQPPISQAPLSQAPIASPAAPAQSQLQVASAPGAGGNTATGAPRAAQEGPGEAGGNADDYAPAQEPSQSPGLGLHVKRGTEEGVPLYSQVATDPGAGIPELRLDMNSWAPRPENRFALINMKQLREGDSLPQGIRVESITPDGVILSHNGKRFLLTE